MDHSFSFGTGRRHCRYRDTLQGTVRVACEPEWRSRRGVTEPADAAIVSRKIVSQELAIAGVDIARPMLCTHVVALASRSRIQYIALRARPVLDNAAIDLHVRNIRQIGNSIVRDDALRLRVVESERV